MSIMPQIGLTPVIAIAKISQVWYYIDTMYGDQRNLRYILGLGLLIILLFVVIFLIMNSGGKKNKVTETERQLTSYSTNPNVTIRETIIGPITAVQTHNQAQISVTNEQTIMDVFVGYDGNLINSKTYPMTTSSFSEFLSALDRAGFTRGNTTKALEDDQGYCPTGQRYIFEVIDTGKTVQRFWTTSCGSPKSYKGNTALTLTLFQAQVPDYDDLTANLNL